MELAETKGKCLVVAQFLLGVWICLCIQGALMTAGKAIQKQAIDKCQYLCWDVGS